jgi:GNAT superfamily N-acetyltransferase
MGSTPFDVRAAAQADLGHAAAMMADAFAGDPWFRWLYPDDATWTESARAWFGIVLDRAYRFGHTHCHEAGAINWIPPGQHFPEEDDVAAAVELLTAQIGDRAMTALGVIGRAGATFPDQERFHCVYVAVDPARQGQGHGRVLLAHTLAICDRDDIPASLTSTNDANLPLYRSLGFEEIGAIPIPGTDKNMRPMWRKPRTGSLSTAADR